MLLLNDFSTEVIYRSLHTLQLSPLVQNSRELKLESIGGRLKSSRA